MSSVLLSLSLSMLVVAQAMQLTVACGGPIRGPEKAPDKPCR